MATFYSRLSYSFGNEDWNTEHQALRIQPTDKVLCVTASGDRPLNLMTKELKEIVAVDANPMQNALFDLKKVALSELDFSSYLAFMGATPSKSRLKAYAAIEKHLDPMTSALWELQLNKIEKGVLYQGSVEKMLSKVSKLFRTFRGKKISTLFEIDNLKQQQSFVDRDWHTYLWKKVFDVGLHPVITRNFIKDPGLYEYVDPSFHVGNQIYSMLHDYLHRHLAKESILLSLVLKGEVDPRHFPPYLKEDGVAKIKGQVNKARFHTDDIISYVKRAPPNSFDCFSISDVASYMSKEQFNVLVQGIYKCAKPNARFCLRQLLTKHEIPASLSKHFKIDTGLAKQLQEADRCFVYSFITGTIKK